MNVVDNYLIADGSYDVKTSVFDGPFDVLLSLIEKRKLFISDIALAQVADDFIAYIQEKDDFPLRESTYFISIATTLILIKSKSLLPSLDLTEDEEEGIEQLEIRLNVYKKVKEEARRLKSLWALNRVYFGRGEKLPVEISFVPDETVTQKRVMLTAYDIIDRLPSLCNIPQVSVKEVVKLQTVITSLIKRVSKEIGLSFNGFSGLDKKGGPLDREKKYLVVVSFIAVLELVKQGVLSAVQRDDCCDIYIESIDLKTPNYT